METTDILRAIRMNWPLSFLDLVFGRLLSFASHLWQWQQSTAVTDGNYFIQNSVFCYLFPHVVLVEEIGYSGKPQRRKKKNNATTRYAGFVETWPKLFFIGKILNLSFQQAAVAPVRCPPWWTHSLCSKALNQLGSLFHRLVSVT